MILRALRPRAQYTYDYKTVTYYCCYFIPHDKFDYQLDLSLENIRHFFLPSLVRTMDGFFYFSIPDRNEVFNVLYRQIYSQSWLFSHIATSDRDLRGLDICTREMLSNLLVQVCFVVITHVKSEEQQLCRRRWRENNIVQRHHLSGEKKNKQTNKLFEQPIRRNAVTQ